MNGYEPIPPRKDTTFGDLPCGMIFYTKEGYVPEFGRPQIFVKVSDDTSLLLGDTNFNDPEDVGEVRRRPGDLVVIEQMMPKDAYDRLTKKFR